MKRIRAPAASSVGEAVVREVESAMESKKSKEIPERGDSGPKGVVTARAKKYMQEYYVRNREKLLERNQSNRKSKVSLQRLGIEATGKRGRPPKKRADVDHDTDEVLSPEELQREIARHEKVHEEWLKEVEENRKELLRMYEEDEDAPVAGMPPVEEDEPSGPMTVTDVVRVLRAHQAKDVVTLDLRHKTDLCDHKGERSVVLSFVKSFGGQ